MSPGVCVTVSPQEEDEEYNDDELNPFSSLGDEVCDALTSEREAPTSKYSRVARADWGIPSFREQIDRNITNFTLVRLDRTPEEISKSVTIELQHRTHSTGSDLWDSALVLAHALPLPSFLQTILKENDCNQLVDALWFHETRILELGSGTGALGLYCAKCLGAKHVTMTDLPANLDLIQSNAQLNECTDNITIAPLDWTDAENSNEEVFQEGFDLIIGTDLCEYTTSHDGRRTKRKRLRSALIRISQTVVSIFIHSFTICSKSLGSLGHNHFQTIEEGGDPVPIYPFSSDVATTNGNPLLRRAIRLFILFSSGTPSRFESSKTTERILASKVPRPGSNSCPSHYTR
jgi:hypothetical protein